jgi:hypothetical protein
MFGFGFLRRPTFCIHAVEQCSTSAQGVDEEKERNLDQL